MALVPKINICINSKCNKIDIYEQTSPYVLATNATGWGAPNINTTAITAASLTIYDHTGLVLQNTITMYDGITDVYSGVAGSPAPGSFLAIKDYSWDNTDGIFKLVYTVTDGITVFTNEQQFVLFTCNLKNCIDGLKSKAVTACDSKSLEKVKSKINQLEILLYGIESAFSCPDFTQAMNLIANSKTICDNLCDCGCGDC